MTQPEAIVREALDRLNNHDVAGYYDLCANDFLYVGTSTRRGKQQARAADEPFLTAVPDHWRRIDRLLVSGDTVAVWLTLGGTPVATGKAFEAELCDVIVVRDGLIRSLTMYADWPTLMSNLRT